MTKLRYNIKFKRCLKGLLICAILAGVIITFFIISKIQYDQLVSDMKPLEATIVDIDNHIRVRGIDEQEIYIEYVVDGVVYSRELKTDTKISFFSAGEGAHYSIGDKTPIFYDPQNPEIIASPRSISVGYYWLIAALIFLAMTLLCLIIMLITRRKFLVTQEEYDKELEDLKRSK